MTVRRVIAPTSSIVELTLNFQTKITNSFTRKPINMSKPTMVFFAGAFADPSCFDTFSKHLQQAGHPTAYAYVPSLNSSDPTTVSASQDAQLTREKYLLPLLDEGKDVVVFAHSYGGVVGGAAATGLSKASRSAEGKPGGIIGLIYCVGNVVGEGETLLQAVGSAYPPFIQQDHVCYYGDMELTISADEIRSHRRV